ncbi:hypothetical protein ACET3Z_019915 [Daucus carota]
MTLNPSTFETILPSRFITFTYPSPTHPQTLLRVAVLDSPLTQPSTESPQLAAMFVPTHRETDWIFSTQSGHLQLLLNFAQFSRLILIGYVPISPNLVNSFTRPECETGHAQLVNLEEKLTPLLFALAPKSCFVKGLPEVVFLRYEDDLIGSVVVEVCDGGLVGEMVVEDVELEGFEGREFRRRLRFKRMPNFVQTQVRIFPKGGRGFVGLEGVEFGLDFGVLVHSYLVPMVAGVSLIGGYLDERIQCGFRPKALCLGVGGGALLGFLSRNLGFEVIGVEADEVVLRVARQYFGLDDCDGLVRVCLGDAIEFLDEIDSKAKRLNIECLDNRNINGNDAKFDVVMVDLDSSDVNMGISAPPLEFVQKDVLLAAKRILCDQGILVINVIPPAASSFYETLIMKLKVVFEELYEVDVRNGENFVLIAAASTVGISSSGTKNVFASKLKQAISAEFIDSIKKL